ncbi:MAG: DUF58 domain-containing protein [Chloroflexi bacterium]|nr:DUF58 domain-containing protein [Chloroflexota bacterium]
MRRYVRLLGSLLLLLATALVLANATLLFLGVFALSLVMLGLSVEPPSPPTITRSIRKTSFWVDETITVELAVSIQGGIGPVLIFDELQKEMELVLGSNIRLFWKGPGVAEFIHSYSVRCPRRGVYELPPTQWETRHPLEFLKADQGRTGEPLRITVLPRVLAIRRVRNVRGLAVTPYPMVDIARVGVATTDFREIREYVPGDPIRNINWKATARQVSSGAGKPLVNVFEFEGKKAVWLFFDSSEHMGVGTNIHSPLEHGIEAASALGYYYLSRGYYVGGHFSVRPDKFLYPDAGRRQFYRLTQELLTLRPYGRNYDLPGAVRVCQSQLLAYLPRCVILTRLDTSDEYAVSTPDAAGVLDDSLAAVPKQLAFPVEHHVESDLLRGVRSLLSFSRSRRSRISVWIIALNGYSYAPSDAPTGPAAAALRAFETRPLVRELRRNGASVLAWNPFQEAFAKVLLRQLKLERSST